MLKKKGKDKPVTVTGKEGPVGARWDKHASIELKIV